MPLAPLEGITVTHWAPSWFCGYEQESGLLSYFSLPLSNLLLSSEKEFTHLPDSAQAISLCLCSLSHLFFLLFQVQIRGRQKVSAWCGSFIAFKVGRKGPGCCAFHLCLFQGVRRILGPSRRIDLYKFCSQVTVILHMGVMIQTPDAQGSLGVWVVSNSHTCFLVSTEISPVASLPPISFSHLKKNTSCSFICLD